MKKILIIGATSAIAEATARIWAQNGEHLFLMARNAEKLDAVAANLRVIGAAKVETYIADINDFNTHIPLLDAAEQALQGLDTILIAHGLLSDQAACQQSVEQTLHEINTNGLSTIALLTHAANRFEARRNGVIAIISSPAGDRGKQSNYIYGAAKALVTTFASGLRQRLAKAGVAVITIKPGFVDTPMTAHFKKGSLWATPEAVAKDIVRACDKRNSVIYTPWFWFWIMLIIKHIPEKIFVKLSL
jgi:decaprenylphospho-beta-D-erythro-pentofuranosid-2-ulose 2-reductase